MKTLKNTIILYDADCPACDLYTKGFVKSGMLDENGRVPFQMIDEEMGLKIDRKRACNEIALINMENHNVLYGTESLLEIIGNNFPWIKKTFQWTPLSWLLKKLYAFISYNRKVIVPGKAIKHPYDCIPDFNINYRVAYILLVWVMTAIVLNRYSITLAPLIPPSTLVRELAICGGQILFQWLYLNFRGERNITHYLGNMMTVSLMGAILLLPAFMFSFLGANSNVHILWFMAVVGLMFLEHMRRVKIIGIHWTASISWVFYRLLILLIIL